MAGHSVRRWLQFDILDLMILTTVAAVFAVLWRPVKAHVHEAVPWVVGGWANSYRRVWLYPDGVYASDVGDHDATGVGWKVARSNRATDEFVLSYGEQRIAFRMESPTSMSVLNEDGSLRFQLEQDARMEGPLSPAGNVPDGTWYWYFSGRGEFYLAVIYRDGEVIDVRTPGGDRSLPLLNSLRHRRGLSFLTDDDCLDHDAPKAKMP